MNVRLMIGSTIRIERSRMKYTQFELGEEAGLHYNYIGQIERGEKDITVQSLLKICRVFGISLVEFFELVNL